jgi:DNA-binding transcriptional LysR family regulator
MLDPLELRIFLSVTKELNFAAAAKSLKLAPSQVSKAIASLERKIERQLFVRTTRQVRLTNDGELLIPAARKAFDAVRDASEFFNSNSDDLEVAGRLKISCPHTLGVRKIAGLAADFHALHPNVSFEFVLSDSYLDLIEDNIDTAIRIVAPRDSTLVARKLAENPIVFCASPNYLAIHTAPKTIDELQEHQLLYIPQHGTASFKKSGKTLNEVTKPRWAVANQGDFLVELALKGAGILVRSSWGVEREIASGELVPFKLNDTLVLDTAIYAMYAATRYVPPRLRLWIDHLVTNWTHSEQSERLSR